MALFLPPNVTPLPPAASLQNWNDGEYKDAEYFNTPKDTTTSKNVEIDYIQLEDNLRNTNASLYVQTILDRTPKPKGRNAFSSIHIVGPHTIVNSEEAEHTIQAIRNGASALGKEVHLHRLSRTVCSNESKPMDEYTAIFEVASDLILEKADRASLLVFVGWEDVSMDSYAAFCGMLPFRGIQVALLSRRKSYGDLLRFRTPSGTFDMDGLTSARMGKFPVHSVFGPSLGSKRFQQTVRSWSPVDIEDLEGERDVVKIPFKIGGLSLPMLTHNGRYEEALKAFSELLSARYPKGYTPIISVGETCDALGYGQDMLDALVDQKDGLLFTHRSGETYKRYDNYGSDTLFSKINEAKCSASPPVIIAVGGGVNGNCIGLIAALTNCDFIEVPTTPMHYNDAVTSAKKAFSLVVNDRILSKNILGAFYLPQLAFCVNEMLLTISSANAHATVGEATKTMNMLGMANSAVGAADFHNILGGMEFASDFTNILSEVEGFDKLIDFIEKPNTLKKKRAIIEIGKKIATIRDSKNMEKMLGSPLSPKEKMGFGGFVAGSMPSLAGSSSGSEDSSSESDSEDESLQSLEELILERKEMMNRYRASFHKLPTETKQAILSFLTTINREIVAAKAMFLAYSDPFEKYRALLFEYAHTLGHGVEAFANDLYLKARQLNIVVPSDAFRLHGQCVGMAVLWAGEMSRNLGKLEGEGYILHQSFPYLFNRSGGFNFGPLRQLCDELGVGKEEFCEKVLQVVRRDNKRGYCNCSDPNKSVDQLVTCRPGKMLKSDDPNAEMRYLVEVDEEWQKQVLERAFDLHFDKVADMQEGKLVFVPSPDVLQRYRKNLKSRSSEVAAHIRIALLEAYAADINDH